MLRAALLLVSASGLGSNPLNPEKLVDAAVRDFPETACRDVARNPATPAKALEEACKQEMALSGGQCEFFSEAWGLAITHPGYSSEKFCGAVAGAFECSEMMDDVLTSGAVADLAFAACVKKQGEAKVGYCLKFQSAISEADKSTDLDTLRACYLMEEEAKTTAGPIISKLNATANVSIPIGNGSAATPAPLLSGEEAARPFGVPNGTGTVPAAPPRITVEPMHAVRKNGSAYEDHHILAGDGPLQSVGKGSSGPATIPAVPPPTRHELAVDAGKEAGGLAGATAGAAAGKEAGQVAGTAAGEDVAIKIAENKTIPKTEVEAAAYKAGFEAGQAAGSSVVASLVAKKVAKAVAQKPKATLLGKAKKTYISSAAKKAGSVVKKAVGTIKHHPAHPARKTSAAHDAKAPETAKRLGARKTDKADSKVEDEEKKKEDTKAKDAPLSEFLTKFSKLD
jgi:hypothetical protein